MTDTTKLFQLAQLAEASYAKFDQIGQQNSDGNILDVKRIIELEKFSPTQSDEFVKNWQVVHHQPDTGSSYSGTLFRYIGNDPNSGFSQGELVFAQRGTAGLIDLIATDFFQIASNGLAIDQIIDMYNYWQRLITPAGGAATQATLVAADGNTPSNQLIVKEFPQPDSPSLFLTVNLSTVNGLGLGKVDATDILAGVTGHSLGGHLAAAFTRLFAEMDVEATSINGAGYATGFLPGLAGTAQNNIVNLFNLLNGDEQFGAVNNLYGDKMPNFITQDGPGLFQVGTHDGIYVEQDLFYQNTFGHGSGQMTDTLAVYDLFVRMDASLRSTGFDLVLQKLKPIFEGAGNQDKYTLEIITSALGRMLGTSTDRSERTEFADREALYVAVKSIHEALATVAGTMTVHVLDTTVTQETMVQNAQADIAWRYALMELNPFVISGFDYNDHNTQGELNLYNPVTGSGNISEKYLNDRAAMLTWKLKYDSGEKDDNDLIGNTNPLEDDKAYSDDWDTNTVEGNWDFVDISINIDGAPLTLAIDGTGITPFDHQIIFGSKDNDTFNGSGDVDHLYGMAGNVPFTFCRLTTQIKPLVSHCDWR